MTKAMHLVRGASYYGGGSHENDTVKKLKSMSCLPLRKLMKNRIDQEAEYGSMSFHERLMLLVDAEYDSRHNNNIKD